MTAVKQQVSDSLQRIMMQLLLLLESVKANGGHFTGYHDIFDFLIYINISTNNFY